MLRYRSVPAYARRVVPDPLAHVYDLALRALAEQERQVAALHGRLAPVLAAGGLAATLLAPAAFRGDHPAGTFETVCVVVGLAGIAVAVLAGAFVLLPRSLMFGLDVAGALAFVRQAESAHQERYFESMIVGLDQRRRENDPAIRRIHEAFTVVLGGMLVGMCGLGMAAAVA